MSESKLFQEGETLYFHDRAIAFEVSSNGRHGLAYVYEITPCDHFAIALADPETWTKWSNSEIDFRGLMCHENSLRFVCTVDDWISNKGDFRARPLHRPFKETEMLVPGKFRNFPW